MSSKHLTELMMWKSKIFPNSILSNPTKFSVRLWTHVKIYKNEISTNKPWRKWNLKFSTQWFHLCTRQGYEARHKEDDWSEKLLWKSQSFSVLFSSRWIHTFTTSYPDVCGYKTRLDAIGQPPAEELSTVLDFWKFFFLMNCPRNKINKKQYCNICRRLNNHTVSSCTKFLLNQNSTHPYMTHAVKHGYTVYLKGTVTCH